MLPKIIVANKIDREKLDDLLPVLTKDSLIFEGTEAKVEDLRRFIKNAFYTRESKNKRAVVIIDADKLSESCQSVLLKPLEEVGDDSYVYLVVQNENGLSETIRSRSLVEKNTLVSFDSKVYWERVRKCFEMGPSFSLSFVEEIDKNEVENVFVEIVYKLKSGLSSLVSAKRLAILKLAIKYLSDVRSSNVNPKLALGSFLLASWKIVNE